MDDDVTMPPSSPTAATPSAAAAAATVSLPNDAVFDILSRAPVKSVCRFRCVSRGWRDLISDPAFLAEHKTRYPGSFLVDAGSFHDGPVESRDLRLMDMNGSLVRTIKGVGGSGMICSTSLDDLICVNGGPSDGAHVVDPATGEVLVSCPQLEVLKRDTNLGILTRCYTTFGFGRAAPSGTYKMVRIVEARTCEILTLGDDTVAGWRQAQAPPIAMDFNHYVPYRRGSPITINGVMYFLATIMESDDTLLCLDLESEQWREKAMEGPRNIVGEEWRRKTISIRITELNGSLCMVQTELDHSYHNPHIIIDDPCTNIWLLADPDNGVWIKAYSIPMAPYASRYMPMREIAAGKLLLHCSLEDEVYTQPVPPVLVLQVYDPRTGKCTDVTGTPPNLAGRIGLCSFHLERLVTAKNRRCL